MDDLLVDTEEQYGHPWLVYLARFLSCSSASTEIDGTLHRIPLPLQNDLIDHHLGSKGTGILMGLAFISLLRAYANGGSSLTGLEAISDGVGTFRRAEAPKCAKDARHHVVHPRRSSLLGVSFPRHGPTPIPFYVGYPTVVSQEAMYVFGGARHRPGQLLHALVATMMILYTGGNTCLTASRS